ncbi:MBL fold metallo-hydrolase [Candidatus Parcubacteria bacterium]|nr:MAG: MBL fold metallo-hydrolase [Candidatus Parcubacteria bacterium]
MITIQFFGGALEVTGALYLVKTDKAQFLIDCGLFQVGAFADKRNYQPFSFDVSKIDFVCITHAHIDHSGRLPKLDKAGFSGKIHTTKGTADLMRLMLEDSHGLLEEEAKHLKKDPLYDHKDVEHTFEHLETHEYGESFEPVRGIEVKFQNSGHILGSSIIEIWIDTKIHSPKSKKDKEKIKIVFTGDLGNWPNPLLQKPAVINEADYLVIESAYGDRLHEATQKRKDVLEDVIEEVVRRRGVVMIPSFAVERTQVLLSELNELVENGRIPKVPVFLDSPLAIKATAIYKQNRQYFNEGMNKLLDVGEEIFRFPGLKMTATTEESKAINDVIGPKIIIAGSGNSMGGRIMHHERRYLSDPNSAIIIVGYQVASSLGRKLLEGADVVKIFGEKIPVRARVVHIEGYSGHADREALFKFVEPVRHVVKKVFVVQGEEHAALNFAQFLKDNLAVEAEAPSFGGSFALE